jgi:hypothetical protein
LHMTTVSAMGACVGVGAVRVEAKSEIGMVHIQTRGRAKARALERAQHKGTLTPAPASAPTSPHPDPPHIHTHIFFLHTHVYFLHTNVYVTHTHSYTFCTPLALIRILVVSCVSFFLRGFSPAFWWFVLSSKLECGLFWLNILQNLPSQQSR